MLLAAHTHNQATPPPPTSLANGRQRIPLEWETVENGIGGSTHAKGHSLMTVPFSIILKAVILLLLLHTQLVEVFATVAQIAHAAIGM